MNLKGNRDESRNTAGEVVWYRQWPDSIDGDIDDNGAVRPLNDTEKDEWRAAIVASYPSAEESAKLAARLVVLPKITADELDDEQIEQLTGLFPDWEPDITVAVGEVYRWDGTLVEVIQAHTTQADWKPSVVPALFKTHRSTDLVADWIQPVGAHDAYSTGERVTYEGQTWVSTSDNNVWAPGVFGWEVG